MFGGGPNRLVGGPWPPGPYGSNGRQTIDFFNSTQYNVLRQKSYLNKCRTAVQQYWIDCVD